MTLVHDHHLSLNHEGWGTTDDFTTSFLHFFLFSTALWDSANSRSVHSLMLSSHLFLCLPCLLSPFTVPCKMVLARPDEQETWPYHCSLHLFMVVRSSCGPIACWILAQTSWLPQKGGRGCLMSFPPPGISGLSFDSTLLSPLLFFCLVLLPFCLIFLCLLALSSKLFLENSSVFFVKR